MTLRSQENRVRPQMSTQKSNVEYIRELAFYTGADVPKNVFAPTRELQSILEMLADAQDENETLKRTCNSLSIGYEARGKEIKRLKEHQP